MRTWIAPSAGNTVVIAEIAIVELASVLTRRYRERSITSAELAKLRDDFLVHTEHEYNVIAVRSPIMLHASQLVSKYPLRTLDALQLACAHTGAAVLGSMPIFVSADRNLLAAAAGEGFPTDDPNRHA